MKNPRQPATEITDQENAALFEKAKRARAIIARLTATVPQTVIDGPLKMVAEWKTDAAAALAAVRFQTTARSRGMNQTIIETATELHRKYASGISHE